MADSNKVKLQVKQGSTFAMRLIWSIGDSADTAVPVDLTGYTARLQMRDDFGGTLLHEMTTENGGLTLNVAQGAIDMLIDALTTDNFDWDTAVYDIELVQGDYVNRLFSGTVVVSPSVTRGST